MNHPPSRIVRELLIDGSGALFTDPSDASAWPVYIGHLPDGEAVGKNCAAVYDTSGIKEGRTADGEEQMLFGFQLSIRSDGYEEGWVKAKAAADFLAAVHNSTVTLGSDTYSVDSISQPSPPLALGVERGTSRRQLFSLNGLLRVT